MTRPVLILTLAVLTSSPLLADAPARHRGDFLLMLDAVLSGSQMGPGDGWFKPGETRYTWDRLRARFDADKNGRVTAKEFTGPEELFTVLDRDGDGAITADDLDWADDSLYARQLNLAQQVLRRGDQNGNRKLTKEEWLGLFERAAKGQDALDAEGVRKILFPPAPPRPPFAKSGGGPPREVLVLGLFTGELGSAAEGPKLEAPAPDFTLKTPEGKSIALADYNGKKPIVLIFGSFT